MVFAADADEQGDPAPTVSIEPSVTTIDMPQQASSPAVQKSDYNLPYPGILPDNPLYFLKAARDRLVSFLISDYGKKTEFNLLTSDKRISAAQILSTRGESDLAISTLSKSNNYFEEAVTSAKMAHDSGKNINPILHSMQDAVGKHLEILGAVRKKVSSKYESALKIEEQRLSGFNKTVAKLLQK